MYVTTVEILSGLGNLLVHEDQYRWAFMDIEISSCQRLLSTTDSCIGDTPSVFQLNVDHHGVCSPVPRLLSSFLSHTVQNTVCDKSWGGAWERG